MSSSSELEVVSRPRKPTSSPEVRRSGRARRVPRGPDETAAAAAPMARTGSGAGPTGLPGALGAHKGELVLSRRRGEDDSDDDLEPPIKHAQAGPAAAEQGPVASTSRMQLPPLPSLPPLPALPPLAPTTTSTSPALNPSSSAPALGSAPASKPAPARSASLAARPQPVARRSRTPADSTAAAAPPPAPPPRAAPPPKTSYSSDEADSFFGARKPKPKMRVPAAARAGSSAAAGGAAAHSRASSGSATPRPTSPAKRQRPPTLDLSSSSSSDSDSSPRRNALALTSDSDDARPSKLTKALKLPVWAMQGSAVSGADRKRAAQGAGRNRKRKKLGESGSEAEPDEGAGGRAGARGKGKEKEKDAGGLVEMGDGDGDDHGDTDDSLELALVNGSKRSLSKTLSSSPPKLPPLRSPRKRSLRADSHTSFDRLSAGPAPAKSPYRSSRRALPNPHNLLSSSPQRASHISLSSTSSDHSAGMTIALGSDDDDDDDDDMPIDATLAAIRRSLASARRDGTKTTASTTGGAGGARPFSSPAKAASASPGGRSSGAEPGAGPRGGAAAASGDDDKVTVRLRMVFDPTRQAPEVAKRAYEREEVVEMGLHEPFESLFYEISQRRGIPRADLVITHLRPSSSSTSTSTSSQSFLAASSSASAPASTKQTQLYEFGTPASLALRAGAEPLMRAYTHDVWNKVRERAKEEAAAKMKAHEDEAEATALARARARAGSGEGEDGGGERAAGAASNMRGKGAIVLDLEDDDDDDEELLPPPGARAAAAPSSDSPSPAATATATAAAASTSSPRTAASTGLFPLTLRSSSTQSFSLAVKPSTTVTQLVRAFCRKYSIPPARQTKIIVEFDGERLEGGMTLDEARAEFDLEGEETFELRGVA